MHEEYHISILLDGTGFTEVTQLRSLSFQTLTVLYITGELRKSKHRNIQLFCYTFQRTGDGRYLLLTATKLHTIGIHQLEIVDHQQFNTLFPYQSASLGTEFENRKTRRIININRCTCQFSQFFIQPFPFWLFQLSVQYFFTRNLANIRDESVHQLNVIHFQREESDRHIIIYRHILGNTQCKGSLTHGRTTSDNHKVGRLPTRCHIIQSTITRRNTGKTTRVLSSTLQDGNGLLYNRINLGIILLHIVLRKLEEFTFSFLHQFIHIHTFFIRHRLDVAGIMNQLALHIFLRQDTGMRLYMGSRSHACRNIHEILCSSHLIQFASLG